MKKEQKQAIIESGKQYFRSIIIPNHLKNLDKLHLSSFDMNPFFHQLCHNINRGRFSIYWFSQGFSLSIHL